VQPEAIGVDSVDIGGDRAADGRTGRLRLAVTEPARLVALLKYMLCHHQAAVEGHAPRAWNGAGLADEVAFDERRAGKTALFGFEPPAQHAGPVGQQGLMEARRRGEHHDYCLTNNGRELKPVVVALSTWGAKWIRPGWMIYAHANCGGEVALQMRCAVCDATPSLSDVVVTPRPGRAQ
jgi:hypothetical protein